MPDRQHKPSTPIARKLRRNATEAEKRLWQRLRGRQLLGFKFRRQSPVGGFIADFLCEELRIIIEADGGQHAYWNKDVMSNMEGVLEDLRGRLIAIAGAGTPHPTLSQGERAI